MVFEPSARRVAIAALSTSALVYTHVLMATVLAHCVVVTVVAILAVGLVSLGRQLVLAVPAAAAGVLALCAPYLLPLVAHRQIAGEAASWSPEPLHVQMANLVRGRLMFDESLAFVVLAAWIVAVALAMAGRRYPLFLCGLAVGSLLAVHAVRGLWPGDVTNQMPWRSLTSIGVMSLLPVAAVIDELARLGASFGIWLEEKLSAARQPEMVLPSDGHGPVASAGDVLGAGVCFEPVGQLGRNRSLLQQCLGIGVAMLVVFGFASREDIGGQLQQPYAEMYETAAILRELVPPHARFAVEEDFPDEIARLGVIAPSRWLMYTSGRNVLNAFNPELLRGSAPFVSRDIKDPAVSNVAARLGRLGVTHVVSSRRATRQRLAADAGLRVAREIGPITIWEVLNDDQYAPAALLAIENGTLSATYEAVSNELHRFTVELSDETPVGIAIGASPRWRVQVDGRAVSATRYDDGRLRVVLPAGRHEITVEYAPDWRTFAGMALALVALVTFAWLWRRDRRAATTPAPLPR